ncbi:MAG TPA: hydroxypyruvate isomerase family protein [Plasticicumulans sp.]|nr:hydroxypyruvate isomerase family protein [Plasticicumulans sp.]
MPRFAANLSFLFTELPFPERFAAAAAAGFGGVEFLFPYAWPVEAIAGWRRAASVDSVLFNLPPGDWEAGERGLACLPGREAEFLDGIERALPYALALGTPRLHAMAGLLPTGADPAHCRQVYVDNLRRAAARLAAHGIMLLIEPINPRDMPGYFLNTQADAHAIREAVGAPNLRVQTDLYHAQIVEGDLAVKLERWLAHIGHLQIAGVPGRHEPDHGEIHYPYLFALLDRLGYDGWIGCEYRPAAGTVEGLGWYAPWRTQR